MSDNIQLKRIVHGDGVTDDTEALQDYIDGKKVKFYISRPLRFMKRDNKHVGLTAMLREYEHTILRRAIEQYMGNITKMASVLCITRKGLYLKLKFHDLVELCSLTRKYPKEYGPQSTEKDLWPKHWKRPIRPQNTKNNAP